MTLTDVQSLANLLKSWAKALLSGAIFLHIWLDSKTHFRAKRWQVGWKGLL